MSLKPLGIFACIPLPSLMGALIIIGIGGPDIKEEGEHAYLSEWYDEQSSYDPDFDASTAELISYENSPYSVSAEAGLWDYPEDTGYSLEAFLNFEGPDGPTLTFGYVDYVDRLTIDWETPSVDEPTDFTFSYGVVVKDGTEIIETLQSSATLRVLPALPTLSGNLLSYGLRLRDPDADAVGLSLEDPDETIDGSELRWVNPDPRLILRHEVVYVPYYPFPYHTWFLEWNDAWHPGTQVKSELVPLRFKARDAGTTEARWTEFERSLMLYGHHYEDTRIVPPTSAENGRFGASVTLMKASAQCPETAFIAEEGKAVHIYEANGFQEWTAIQVLENPDAAMMFGSSLSAEDGVLAVGAVHMDGASAGRVFLYRRDFGSGTWELFQTLIPDETWHEGVFGGDVALTRTFGSGSGHLTLMVAADGGSSRGSHTGAVWCYEMEEANEGPPTFAKHQVIVPEGASDHDYFGWPLALQGDIAVLPSNEDDDLYENSGAVYVYRRNAETGLWEAQQKLKASDADYDDLFGERVAISEQGIFVAAFRKYLDDGAVGAVYHFRELDGVWEEQGRIRTVEEAAVEEWIDYGYFGDGSSVTRRERRLQRFGSSVEAEGNTLLIAGRRLGAQWLDAFGRSVVYHFEWNEAGGDWEEVRTLCGSDTDSRDVGTLGKLFGEAQALAIAGESILVGDFGSEADGVTDSGLAYSFFRLLRPTGPPSGYFEFRDFFVDLSQAEPDHAAPGDDPDLDGVSNLHEFFAGTDGLNQNAAPYRPEVSIQGQDGPSLSFVFRQDKNSSGLQPAFEFSRSLEADSWAPLANPSYYPDADYGDHFIRTLDLTELKEDAQPLFIRMLLKADLD